MKSNLEQAQERQQKKIKTEQYNCNGWKFVFTSGGILPSVDLDNVQHKLKLNNISDVVFGYNQAILINEENNFVFEIMPVDSLSYCNFEARQRRLLDENCTKTKEINHINIIPKEVKIKFTEKWKQKKIDPEMQSEIKTLEQISDCFYSTGYKGTVRELKLTAEQRMDTIDKGMNLSQNLSILQELARKIDDSAVQHPFYSEKTDMEIPIQNLGQDNPILWANMIHLWEDELGDNGHTMSEFRFRTMNNCFFGLLRHYLRVDDVLVRIYDTRIYHEYGQDYILREFQVREDTYENIAAKGFKFTAKWMIDEGQSHLIYNFVDTKQVNRDKIYFKQTVQQQEEENQQDNLQKQ